MLRGGVEVRMLVDVDVSGVNEHDATAVRLGFARRKLQQIERAFDIHVVRGHRRELGSGRQQCGKMKNQVDLELRQDALEQVHVEDRAGELAVDEPGDVRIQRVDVERDDGFFALLRKVGYQRMANLAVGAGYENDGFSHGHGASKLIYLRRTMEYRAAF